MKKNVVVLAEAASEIERGIDFYNAIKDGVGLYSRDSIIADLWRLGVYFGEHRIHLGFFRALSSRFQGLGPYRFFVNNPESHVIQSEKQSASGGLRGDSLRPNATRSRQTEKIPSPFPQLIH